MSDSKQRRRSSLSIRLRSSFFRPKGIKGSDVYSLRGNSGADFEGDATVRRGNSSPGLFSALFRRNKNKMYVLIKGPQIFIFTKATSSSPKYAIPLKHYHVHVHDSKGKNQIVELKSELGDIEYIFKFDLKENKEVGRHFGQVLREQIVVGNCDAVKKKLGHPTCITRESLKYAKVVALEKKGEQPAARSQTPVYPMYQNMY